MSAVPERLRAAVADRDRLVREGPALKGGLGALRRFMDDARTIHPSGCVAAHRAAPSRAFRPGITRGAG